MQSEEQHNPADVPCLVLGLIGFGREQEEGLKWLLDREPDTPVGWRTGKLSEADAWCVNGARTQLLGDGSLRVGPGEAGGRSVRLSLDEIDRPIAFSEPLACREFEPAYSFRIDDGPGLQRMLGVFHDRWLAGKAARLWLASRLVAAQHTLTQRVYHLMQGQRLVAVIDRTGDVGLVAGVSVADLQEATWMARPSSAAYVPSAFHRTTLSELVWTYALRTEADLLPARYKTSRIYFRRPPRVAQRLIEDDHLLVMRELVVGAAGFDELQQRTGLQALPLARTLTALYLAGSVTTNPRRARQAWLAGGLPARAQADESLWSPTRGRSAFGPSVSAPQRDFTVPARLNTLPSGGGPAEAAGAS